MEVSAFGGTIENGPTQCEGKALPDLAGTWCRISDLAKHLDLPIEAFRDFGAPPHLASEPEAVRWLQAAVTDGDWVDTFASCHAEAQHRFTCWNQQMNLRYTNSGSRLDYMLCDKEAWERGLVVRSPTTSLPGAHLDQDVPAASEKAALNAATHFGRWHGSGMGAGAAGVGLSLQVDDMRLNSSQFPSEPMTGLVYTPPAYSDHIPTALLLSGTLDKAAEESAAGSAKPEALASQADTKKCSPWTAQKSLASMFAMQGKRKLEYSGGEAAATRRCTDSKGVEGKAKA